jgi:hypothetical protein
MRHVTETTNVSRLIARSARTALRRRTVMRFVEKNRWMSLEDSNGDG